MAASAEQTRALIQAANAGDPVAMTALGRRLLVGDEAPKAPDKGAALILTAAGAGCPEAAALAAVIYAMGIVAPPNWDHALEALRAAAALGDASAEGQLAVLGDLADALDPPAAEAISIAPRLFWVHGIAPPAACDWLVRRATGRLDLATVYDPASGRLDAQEIRTNSLFEFDLAETDLVVLWLRHRIARALALSQDRLEPSNVLHYAPGQRFGRHFDFLQPRAPALAQELATRGQRIATALVYLNDAYEGGETEFSMLGKTYRGGVGDGLFFWNVDPAGAPDVNTLHAGLPTTQGEKWLFSQFVRDRRQP